MTVRPKPQPVGSKLVRLRDVPLEERVRAYSELVRRYQVSEEEARSLLTIVLAPGEVSARVAA